MPAGPCPAALEAEGPTESRTACLSRHALDRRRTETRTVAHWRLESRRAENSERQRDRTARAVQFPRRETPLWNFFRHGPPEGGHYSRVEIVDWTSRFAAL